MARPRLDRIPLPGVPALALAFVLGCALASAVPPLAWADRLAYLDERSPFYVGPGFPRLTTPMWFGEEGVEAVVILSIDDMRETARYREFLAPILARLQEVEGRAPLSIFTCSVPVEDPQLPRWLADGVRLDVHTVSHPCPLLSKGYLDAVAEVQRSLENLAAIPGGAPCAFRMPCCDSINSASPRFFSEILPLVTPSGRFLEADSSVLLFLDEAAKAYAPFPDFATTIEGYPYPYALPCGVWEFPIVAPSDWEAQHLRGPKRQETVDEMARSIDEVVRLQGTYTLCFHPHGWIDSLQVVELIDRAVARHGRKVRFLNFHDAVARLSAHALGGARLRGPRGEDGGVRLLDVDADGFLDVVRYSQEGAVCRLWRPAAARWEELPFPIPSRAEPTPEARVASSAGSPTPFPVRFGVLDRRGYPSAVVSTGEVTAWVDFDGEAWRPRATSPLEGLEVAGEPLRTSAGGRDRGLRLCDIDGDGLSELLVSNELQSALLRWDASAGSFVRAGEAALPLEGIVDRQGRDGGLRLWDVDDDGARDIVLSNERGYRLDLFDREAFGWTRRVLRGKPGALGALPLLTLEGSDRGAWVHGRRLFVANEQTASLATLVETRDFQLLAENLPEPPPTPAEALESLVAPVGFRVELFAAEPLVQDPVAIHFAPDGKLWVVEMRDYPLGAGGRGEAGAPDLHPTPGGVVKVLRDSDGDGRAEECRVFATGLPFPTGVLSFRHGVLVTAAPDILYLEDTDGDDIADVRTSVVTGFVPGNQQHRVNGLQYGVDNWIYGANGESGGEVTLAGERRAGPLRLGGRDFRLRLDLSAIEPLSTRTQFGLALDDLGDAFSVSNSRHVMFASIPDRYLARGEVELDDPVRDIPDHGAMAQVFPLSGPTLSLNEIHVPGHFSSACGPSIYRGASFPEEYRGNYFVCEPVANLVHRDRLRQDGASHVAERADEGREFLASRSHWFRPVFTTTGPDGALWVVDFCRQVIEHPQYIPPRLQQLLDFTAGEELGRIWRVVHELGPGPGPGRCHPDLTEEPSRALAALLEHPTGWWRSTAQRLLVERGPRDCPAAELSRLAASGRFPAARVHALRTLEGVGLLEGGLIAAALADPDPGVRRHALQLAEASSAPSAALGRRVLSLLEDPDPRVRFQALLTVGAFPPRGVSGADSDPPASAGAALETARALLHALRRDLERPWFPEALLSSSSALCETLLEVLLEEAALPEDPFAGHAQLRSQVEGALVERLARRGDGDAVTRFLGRPRKGAALADADLRLLAALGGRTEDPLRLEALTASLPGGSGLLEAIDALLLDSGAPEARRILAARALPPARLLERLATLLVPREPALLQATAAREALRGLAREGVDRASKLLEERWSSLEPLVRQEALEACLGSPRGARALGRALSEGAISPRDLDERARERLLGALEGDEGAAARALLAGPLAASDRGEVIERVRTALGALGKGTPARGREVFAEVCAPCHRLQGRGAEVGPDLAEARSKGADALLESILDPGRMVAPRYRPYAVELTTGVVTSGLIAAESAASLRILRAGGVAEVLPRQSVLRIEAQEGSLMPARLEEKLSPEALRDLLEYLADVPVALSKVSSDQALTARAQAVKEAHTGLREVVEAGGWEAAQASWMGPVRMAYTRQLEGVAPLVWRTDPAPADLGPTASWRVRFPGAMGHVSQPPGQFTLLLGDQRLLDLDVTLESRVWPGVIPGARLEYRVLARDEEDSTGIFTLEVPGALLEPGKPATLTVRGSPSESRRWFGLLPVR